MIKIRYHFEHDLNDSELEFRRHLHYVRLRAHIIWYYIFLRFLVFGHAWYVMHNFVYYEKVLQNITVVIKACFIHAFQALILNYYISNSSMPCSSM